MFFGVLRSFNGQQVNLNSMKWQKRVPRGGGAKTQNFLFYSEKSPFFGPQNPKNLLFLLWKISFFWPSKPLKPTLFSKISFYFLSVKVVWDPCVKMIFANGNMKPKNRVMVSQGVVELFMEYFCFFSIWFCCRSPPAPSAWPSKKALDSYLSYVEFLHKTLMQGYIKGNFDVINAWMYNFEGTINA